MNASEGNRKPACGFTLLELLVAMALMSLVMLAMVAITNGTASLAQGAQGRIGGNSELRTALDRLSADLDLVLLRSDLPTLTINSTSDNDSLEFLVAAPGYSGNRSISNVRYEISTESPVIGLTRAVQGFGWNDEKVPFGNSNSTISKETPKDVLGPRIFRFECQFFMTNGTYSSKPEDLPNARAVVVSLAAIDEQAMAKMNFPVSNLANLFPDSGNNSPAFQNWSDLLQSPTFVDNNQTIPRAILAGIQVSGRMIPLPRQR